SISLVFYVTSQSSIMCYKHYLLILAIVGLANILPGVNCEITTNDGIDSSECKLPFQTVNNGCYYFSDKEMDFNQAVSYCESLTYAHNYEITLAMLDYDKYEDQALLHAVTVRNKTFWVCGKTEDVSTWKWLDERDVNLNAPFWDIDEPGSGENKCMVAQRNVQNSAIIRSYVYDHGCSDSNHFICQTGTINCPEDFIRIGNYCYMKSSTFGIPRLSWKEARDYCQSLSVHEGNQADLAVLGMPDQDDYHLMDNLVARIHGDTWIGAYRNAGRTDCNYQWIDGRELSQESIYWHFNAPYCEGNNSVRLSHVSNKNRTYIGDSSETTEYPFICQMFKQGQ
ncbi:unnamed protein product, partial [Meganyctiphanes norvegica]